MTVAIDNGGVGAGDKFAVRLTGLPYRISADELRQFLSDAGCKTEGDDDILIVKNNQNLPSGKGYARLASESDVEAAVGLSGQSILNYQRYANIEQCDHLEMKWFSRGNATVNGNFFRVRCRNVPYGYSTYDFLKFFGPEAVVKDVEIFHNNEGRSCGEAMVYVSTAEDVEACLNKDGSSMLDRTVSISRDNDNLEEPIPRVGHFLTMKSVPFKASTNECCAFFDPVVCWCVRIVYNEACRPSGNAIAEFGSEEDVEQAIKTKNKEKLGDRFVYLTVDPPSLDFKRGSGRGSYDDGFGRGSGRGSYDDGFGRGSFDGRPSRGLSEGRPGRGYGRGSYDRGSGRGGYDRGSGRESYDGFSGRGRFDNGRGSYDGGSGRGLHNGASSRGFHGGRESYDSVSSRDMHNGGSSRDSYEGGSRRGSFDGGSGRASTRGGSGSRGMYSSGRGQDSGRGGTHVDSGRGSYSGRGRGGSSGSYQISLSGLVFSASKEDIIKWFSSKAKCDDVDILTGEDGRPSGNAIAWFSTRGEATKAMALHREYLGRRFVNLHAYF